MGPEIIFVFVSRTEAGMLRATSEEVKGLHVISLDMKSLRKRVREQVSELRMGGVDAAPTLQGDT
jgi:hypothetical protein